MESIAEWDVKLKDEAYTKGQHIVHSWEFEYDDGSDGCMPKGWYALGLDRNGAPLQFPVRHEYGPFNSEQEASRFTQGGV